MCIYPDCKKQSCYNFEGNIKAIYCSSHKLYGMIDIKNKTCIYEGCKTMPVYNFKGETKRLYCVLHKLDGMIDIKSKICIHSNCKKQSAYNFKGNTKGLYCATHKLDGMVDIKNKTCIYEDCKTIPNYNIEGETKGLYCLAHKLDGMINVKNKTCVHQNCKKQPCYNTEGKKQPTYCFSHKLDGMVNVISKTCFNPNCKKQPNYNFEEKSKALYCFEHKLDGMIDVKHKKCKTHLCYTIVNEKYDGYCLRCYMHIFPDKPVSRNYKTKEFAVVEFVKNKFENYSWIADKMVNNGCSKKRPDLLLDLGYQVIIIEIDENQHIDYDCSCENKRIMELSQDLGHRSIIFIRFNPDDYNTKEKKITSCWGLNGKGICIVKKSKKDEWEQRLHTLEQQINYWVNPENKTDKTIEIIQLFYNNN
jgi:hypothetical protein